MSGELGCIDIRNTYVTCMIVEVCVHVFILSPCVSVHCVRCVCVCVCVCVCAPLGLKTRWSTAEVD